MAVSKFYRFYIAELLSARVVSHARRFVQPAFDGNREAAFSLAVALENQERGRVAVAMWQAKIPRNAFRIFLDAVWLQDHAYVIAEAGSRRRLAAMFKYADFASQYPDHGPEQIWRGAHGIGLSHAASGYSWTTDRDVACWFASRSLTRNPLVVSCIVQHSEISFRSDDRRESEVVLLVKPKKVFVDGTQDDWLAGYARFQEKKLANLG